MYLVKRCWLYCTRKCLPSATAKGTQDPYTDSNSFSPPVANKVVQDLPHVLPTTRAMRSLP
jgi:hypothetical protein